MQKQKNKQKGITLIALVVTIIALIILAGVSISMIVEDNGIITQSRIAKENMEDAEIIEKIELAVTEIQVGDKGYKKLEKDVLEAKLVSYFSEGILKIYDEKANQYTFYINNKIYMISTSEVKEIALPEGWNNIEENRNIFGEKEYAYNNPIIPKGFTPLETKESSWEVDEGGLPKGWNSGLVIIDESGNEFVWIPCTIQEIEGAKQVIQYQCYAQDEKFTNYQVDINSLKDMEEYIPVDSEFSQIEKYQGFYVGRYETGLSENIEKVANKNIENDDTVININEEDVIYKGEKVKPVSQYGKQVWNCVNRDNAAKIAESMISNEEVKTGLITGKQWDTMLKWIIEIGGIYDNSDQADIYYSEKGNFFNSRYDIDGLYAIRDGEIMHWNKGKYSKSKDEMVVLGTGVHTNSKVNNLYDIYGNVWEITTETDDSGKLIQRGIGANAGSNKAAGVHRHGDDKNFGSGEVGFRVVLYIS